MFESLCAHVEGSLGALYSVLFGFGSFAGIGFGVLLIIIRAVRRTGSPWWHFVIYLIIGGMFSVASFFAGVGVVALRSESLEKNSIYCNADAAEEHFKDGENAHGSATDSVDFD